uniref:GDSL esterase/lipase 1 n=1 Tax=Cajanus cajan TaxID=3821 RepID=A0A151SI09_CAJCA|nr:GDSL esterase/lipase 1 [Cajanus cajan]
MFVFGDSIFDPGNIVYVKGREKWLESLHWPYGETYFKHPTGRFSDGRIVPDFIATLAGLPMLSPYLQPHPTPFTYGANFAAGGVGVIVGQVYHMYISFTFRCLHCFLIRIRLSSQ